ncbi:MAG: HutD family protein [Parvibaculaceae bacterium]
MTDAARLRHLRFESYVAKPWKNGQGITRDLLLWPASEHFDIRISLADIPPTSTFSAFPGITRHITRLSGDSVSLRFADGTTQLLELLVPLTFDSGKAPYCEARGSAVRVLNVMTRETSWTASVKPIMDGAHRIEQAQGLILIFAAGGAWTAVSGASTIHLKSSESLLAAAPVALNLRGAPGAKALFATLEPIDGCDGRAATAALASASSHN